MLHDVHKSVAGRPGQTVRLNPHKLLHARRTVPEKLHAGTPQKINNFYFKCIFVQKAQKRVLQKVNP